MSEMTLRERIARAIAVADGKDPDAPAWAHFRGGKVCPEGVCWRDQYGKLADAVLDVLAEPDKIMLDAARTPGPLRRRGGEGEPISA